MREAKLFKFLNLLVYTLINSYICRVIMFFYGVIVLFEWGDFSFRVG